MSWSVADLHLSVWSRWTRTRYRADFDRVKAFCMFIGYPRSGHSMVGAMLNAHRHAVIAHELQIHPLILAGCDRNTLYARLLARAAWFNLRGNTSNYSYQVPNQWQGRFERLEVLGNKRGGSASLAIGEHPDLLDRLAATVAVPLRLVHVVRNPFDNIAAISLWHRLSLDDAIAFYFLHCQTTGNLSLPPGATLTTLHHEALLGAPETVLSGLCEFLGLAADPQYLEDCASVTSERLSYTRRRVPWTARQIADVQRRAAAYPFLSHYVFEMPPESEAPAGTTARRRPNTMLWPRTVKRFFPTEKPPAALDRPARPHPSPAAGEAVAGAMSQYWDETVRQVRRAGPMAGWHGYMRRVYGRLIREWLPASTHGRRLKTDLFEEALSPSAPLHDLGPGSVGLDVSLDVARGARQRLGPGVPCVVADLRAMPFRDGSLRGILSGSSLDHFSCHADVSAGLGELARVMAPGGTLVLTFDNPHNPVVWVRNHLPFRLLKACGLVPYYVGVTLGRKETIRELEALGLDITETRAVAHAPRAPAIWLVRLVERFGRRSDGLAEPLLAFDWLDRIGTRYLTGYYLAFRVVKRGSSTLRSG
jgi:SAM-dependent methyltransferase